MRRSPNPQLAGESDAQLDTGDDRKAVGERQSETFLWIPAFLVCLVPVFVILHVTKKPDKPRSGDPEFCSRQQCSRSRRIIPRIITTKIRDHLSDKATPRLVCRSVCTGKGGVHIVLVVFFLEDRGSSSMPPCSCPSRWQPNAVCDAPSTRYVE